MSEKEKDKEIERLHSIIKEVREYKELCFELYNRLKEEDIEIERLTKQNKALNEMYELTKKEYIRLNNIIKELKAILKSKGYETYIPALERSDKE